MPSPSGTPPTRSDPGPAVSIVIPAYNEAGRISRTLERVFAFLESRPIEAEVILVNDGSDDETGRVVERYRENGLRIVTNERNSGKGFSVRQGVLHSRGDWVLVTDADLSAPIEDLDCLMAVASDDVDIVIGSRALNRSKIAVRQSRVREIGGMAFNLAVRLVLALPFRDTQCGFKLFRRERVLDVFGKQTIDGFGFDPEVLFIAARTGLGIREVPVAWSHAEGTKVRLLDDGLAMFLDLVRIRWRWIRGRYRD
jgi:glycosyltransferase involved in cell wall biosynthesis